MDLVAGLLHLGGSYSLEVVDRADVADVTET